MSYESKQRTWKKLGLIFRPNTSNWWSRTHAALPTPIHIKDGIFRVFFAGRTDCQKSHIGSFDINLDDEKIIIIANEEAILKPGNPGLFDSDGIYPASVVSIGRLGMRLYTIGWNVGSPRPMFYAAIGAAESIDNGRTFNKIGSTPILGRSDFDPCLVTSPVVLFDEGIWRMWYVSGKSWSETDKVLRSHYDIKYAHSIDGLKWVRKGQTCLSAREPIESNISRFWVIKESSIYHAFFGYDCGNGYRIGYARSDDGLSWKRSDELSGIDCSAGGWDGEAISYPAIIKHRDLWYMFYNGNSFGRDGIGLAVCKPFF